MDIRDMTDRKVYRQVLELLLDTLGPLGLKRFLQYSQANRSAQAAARHHWVDCMERETLAHGMQAFELTEDCGSSMQGLLARGGGVALPKAIEEMTARELYQFGLDVIGENLGAAALMKFGRLCKPGTGDSTVARRKWLSTVDEAEFLAQIRQKRADKLHGEKG